jgi:hypothetical protein
MLMLGLAAPGPVLAADFRLMDTATSSVQVADLKAMTKDAAGVRRFTLYTAAFSPLQANGKTFQFIAWSWAFDCKQNLIRSEGFDIYGSDFSAVDHKGAVSPWVAPNSALPPASDFAVYCAASPSRASHAVRLAASDWRAAVRAAISTAAASASQP